MERRHRAAECGPWDRTHYGSGQTTHPRFPTNQNVESPHGMPHNAPELQHGQAYLRGSQREGSQRVNVPYSAAFHEPPQQNVPLYEVLRPGRQQGMGQQRDAHQQGEPNYRAPYSGHLRRGMREERPGTSQHGDCTSGFFRYENVRSDVLQPGSTQSVPSEDVGHHVNTQQSMFQKDKGFHDFLSEEPQTYRFQKADTLSDISHHGRPPYSMSQQEREQCDLFPPSDRPSDMFIAHRVHHEHRLMDYMKERSDVSPLEGSQPRIPVHRSNSVDADQPGNSEDISQPVGRQYGDAPIINVPRASKHGVMHTSVSHYRAEYPDHTGRHQNMPQQECTRLESRLPGAHEPWISHHGGKEPDHRHFPPPAARQGGNQINISLPAGVRVEVSTRGDHRASMCSHIESQHGTSNHRAPVANGDCELRSTYMGGPPCGEMHFDISQQGGVMPNTCRSESQQNAQKFDEHDFGTSFGSYQPPAVPMNRPVVNDSFHFRDSSPAINQQLQTNFQSLPTQTTETINFAPLFQGSTTNPSFSGPQPIGPYTKSNWNVSQAQTNQTEKALTWERHNIQMERFSSQREHGQDLSSEQRVDPFIPPECTSAQDNKTFRHDVPFSKELPGVPPSFLPQPHLGPFAPQSRTDQHIENSGMHLNRHNAVQLGNDGQRDEGVFRQWLANFLAHRRNKFPSKPESSQSASIPETRELIYGALRLVSHLDSLCQTLERNKESGDSWNQDYEKATDIRIELERKVKQLEKPGYIQTVKKKLDKVRKKRLRWQQRRETAEEEKKGAAERAAEKESRIDRWRMQRIQEVEEKKRERELKTSADRVLGEVRKKQSDGKKMLDILKSLEKLRKLRKEAAGRKGVYAPASADETFRSHVNRLRNMVHKRVALYDAEERALRVIVEGEQEEERQRDKDKRLRKEKEKLLQKQRELDSLLFGDTDPLPNLHPLQSFRQFYLQAEQSVVSLVQIRHEWDQFLAPPDHPNASSIPCGWVLPTPPSGDIWATALRQGE